jgi:hypothetical protein
MVLLSILLFGTAFAASVWTLIASVSEKLPRMRALLSPIQPLPELVPSRVTVRWASAPARSARFPLREAA